MWIAISIIIVGLVVVLAVLFALKRIKSLKAGSKIKEPKWMLIGVALGIPLGLPLGLALDNIAIGIPMGLAIGLSIGIALQEKYGKMIKLTKELKKQMIWGTIAGTMTLIAGLSTLLIMLLMYG